MFDKIMLATTPVKAGKDTWLVKVEIQGNQFVISGRGTELRVYITRTDYGYLVSETINNRCGYIPDGCSYRDIKTYMDFKNGTDAYTLAAGINFIISSGIVPDQPVINEKKEA